MGEPTEKQIANWFRDNPTPKLTAEEDARIERVARVMTLMKVGATRQALEKAAELVQKEAWSLGDRRRLPPMIRALAKEQADG